MPTFDGVSVTIRVDGVDLEEFSVERDVEERRVECWVPSQVDKEFEVIVDTGNRAPGPWAADVRADGVLAFSLIFKTEKSSNVGYYQKSLTVDCPFAFSKLELVDDDVLLQLSQGTRIGEIEISCQTVEVEAEVETLNDNPKYENTFIENHKVHERACKGLEEHIGFKEEKHVKNTLCDVRKIEDLGTFVFRYRPLAYLQAQGIAPAAKQLAPVASPSPARNDVASSGSTLTSAEESTKEQMVIPKTEEDDQDIETLQEIRALETLLAQAKARLKRKPKTDDGAQRKKLKMKQLPALLPGGVIDLT